MKKYLIAPFILILLLAMSVSANDLQDALDAHKRKDYKTAFAKFKPLAERGNASAQYNLGVMYYNGLGVTQDYKEAVKWYRLSAEQGLADAQYNLGAMYSEGQGVVQNYVEVHKWFNIAGANGFDKGRESRGVIETRMTPEQVSEAQRLAKRWVDEHDK